jgi:hypothetical protein
VTVSAKRGVTFGTHATWTLGCSSLVSNNHVRLDWKATEAYSVTELGQGLIKPFLNKKRSSLKMDNGKPLENRQFSKKPTGLQV